MRRLMSLSLSASIPNDLAPSSPDVRTFNFFASIWSAMHPINVNMNIIGIDSQSTSPSVPTCQENASARALESANSISTVVIALKMYITANPDRMMVVGDACFTVETIIMTAIGMSEKMNALATIA